MVSTKTKNKPGRVGVKRNRPTRGQLRKNMYAHGYREAKEVYEAKIADERLFLKGLLKLKNAGAIHEAIKSHLG